MNRLRAQAAFEGILQKTTLMIEELKRWTSTDANELYEVAGWGQGYFSVGENGNLWVHPSRESNRKLDLKELIDRLQLRGLDLPCSSVSTASSRTA